MPQFDLVQDIKQLEKRKGGYYYLTIANTMVEQFEKKRSVRLLCQLDNKVNISCGLNHLGDGNYFIIVATRYLRQLKKEPGDSVQLTIVEDPNPLSVEVPEVLQVLTDQDDDARKIYDGLTDGKKRSLIHSINRIKNTDLQVSRILSFLESEKYKQFKKPI